MKQIIDTDKKIGGEEWGRYIRLLCQINRFNNATIDIIKMFKFEDPLPPSITRKLFELGKTNGYVIGKTLFNKSFEYEKNIPLNVYLDIYSKQPNVAEYMIKNHAFLVVLYQSKSFGPLIKEHLLIFNSWDQPIELITTVLNQYTTIGERKNYILKIEKLATLDDSDALQRLICNGDYDDLLFDEAVTGHIKYLLWDEHPGIKGAFTRYVNRINKKAS